MRRTATQVAELDPEIAYQPGGPESEGLRQGLEADDAIGHGSRRVKALAFFLPQFHPIPENDAWWGDGFTDWINVVRGAPSFRDHEQPLLPSELGFYDLRMPEVRARQAALAREHGIFGFCYYYYWFQGKKLLERPIEEILADGEPDFPFCLCWANENWTRRWDGEDQEILIEQRHSPQGDARFIDEVLPALLDPRYVKRDGKPVLLVYRADLLADPVATTDLWREAALRAGLPGLHLCTVWRVDDPLEIGFDAAVEFPPHHFPHPRVPNLPEPVEGFEGEVFDYAAAVEAVEPLVDKGFPVYRGVMPGWDNTARRGKRGWIYAGSTPELYGEWLHRVAQEAADRPGHDDQFVFINAWNEWAEGATLEPSLRHGRAYLEATRAALGRVQSHSGLSLLENRLRRRLTKHAGRIEDLVSYANWQQAVVNGLQRDLSEQSREWSRQIRELRSRIEDPPGRDLWLSLHCGLAGLLLKLPFWLLGGRLRRGLDLWREARRIRRSGLFAARDYLERYPDVVAMGIHPLYHYVRYGAAEGRDPRPDLSEPRPAAAPAAPEVSPGPPEPIRWAFNQDQLEKRAATTTTLLFVSHDAARGGSQIYLLEALKSFSRFPDLELYLLLRRGGELRAELARFAHVLDLEECGATEDSEAALVTAAVRATATPPAVALCNTVASGAVAKTLHRLGLPVVSIVHELPTTIGTLGEQALHDTMTFSDRVVVVSEFVKKALVERFGFGADRLGVLYAGVTGWQPAVERREAARRRVVVRYHLPDDAFLVLGCGTIHHRKGTDLFVQVARSAILDHGLDRAWFVWVGGDELGPLFRNWCEHDLAAFGLGERVVFTGRQKKTADFYLAADAFLLTSREDPFPLVNLEAMARGVPVVAFEGAGGAPEALADGAGVVVPYLDVAEMTRALVRLAEAPRYRAAIRDRALSRIEERFRWDRFVGELRELLLGYAGPKRARRRPGG